MPDPQSHDIYLDWNATAPIRPDVVEAMVDAARSSWGNPASVHATGRRARAVVESLREELARALGFEARDVLLTSGGTEANNLAIARAAALVTSRLEHPSVVRVAEALMAEGRPVHWLPVPGSGRLDVEAIARACAELPAGSWLTLQAANHETGVLQPVREAALAAHDAGARLHVDAVQAFGKVPLAALDHADSVSVAAHKLGGPKGIGALAFRGRAPSPILLGGAQERGLRPGTVDPIAAAGFLQALRAARIEEGSWATLECHRDRLEAAFNGCARVNGDAPRLPHVSNLSFDGVRGDELVAALDLLGVRVSSGSACAAGTAEPSPVIAAMLGRERAASAVRVSLGPNVDARVTDEVICLFLRALGRQAREASRSG